MDTEPPGSDDNGTAVTNGSSADQDRFYLDRGSYQHLDPGDLRSVVPALLGVLCAAGLACNLSAMAALVSNARRRGKLSLVNGLIFNLMLADGLVLAFSAPVRAAAYHRPSWTLGWPVCKTADWFFQSCMAAKSFTVAVMARACYRYVSGGGGGGGGPGKQASLRPGSVLAVLLVTWLAAFSVAAPHLLFATLRRESRGLVCAMAPPPESRGFMWVYVKAYPLAVFCLPLSFAALYSWRAHGRRAQRRATKTQNLRAQTRSRKLTLMVSCLTAAMALLWLPHWVVWMWERHLAERERRGASGWAPLPPLLLSLAAQLLTFSLSLVNPLVVLSLSEEFREGYRGLWRRFTLRRKQPPPKPKPGPHNPTSLMSPHPRPETSGRQREDLLAPQGSATSVHGPNTESLCQPQAAAAAAAEEEAEAEEAEAEEAEEEEGCGGGGTEVDETSLKDGVALPDVEQFWHERVAGSVADENDPVPWEHQGGGGGGRQWGRR